MDRAEPQGDGLPRSLFYRLGSLSVRRKWIVVAIWIAAIVVAGPQLAELQDRMSNGGFEVPGSQSDRVRLALEQDFKGQYRFSDLLVFRSDKFEATEPAFRAVVLTTTEELSKAPGVGAVADPYAALERSMSPDRHTLITSVGLTDSQDDALTHDPELQAAVKRASAKSDVEVLLTGAAPFYSEFSRTTTHDLERAERIALPLSLLILILAFGSLVAAGMPVALALISLAVSFGIISAVAANTTVSLFTQNIASMIGIGVGIDYSLFILTRYREELRAGRARVDAVGEAIATSGKAVFVSALAVVVALSGTLLVNLAAFRSMGFGAMIAVAVAATAALTLLPALFGIVGSKIDSLSLRRRSASQSGGMWHRWAKLVMRRPWIFLIASLAFIALLAAPARHLELGSSGPSILPKESAPRRAMDLVSEAFGAGSVGPIQIVIDHRVDVRKEGFSDIHSAAAGIATYDEVIRVESIATLAPSKTPEEARSMLTLPQVKPFADRMISPDGTSTLLAVISRHDPISQQAQDLVTRLRRDLPAVLPEGATVSVGGDPGLNLDIDDEVQGALPSVVALVLALSFLVLLVFLRSILLPLKAILMNTASVVAAYGLVVFVFQDGHGEGLLSFSSQGHVESFLPLFLFCILFGLSMDYEVFLLARIREEYLRTKDNTEAVGWGLEHTARIITSAAAVMVTVFGAFAFASLIPIKAMGFGLAAAVFLDATVIRIVLVPATMRLLGDWNWWIPRWLDRLLPNVSLEGTSPARSARVPEPVEAG